MEQLADPWQGVTPLTKEQYVDAIAPERVNSKTAADMLGVTEGHLRQLVKRGHLTRAGKDGKRASFLRSDVKALRDKRSGVSRLTTTSDQYDDSK